ncbi:hypothetical protein Nepgr_031023 [Nepenthes gracilis]|uniref:Uncharacterized protein n=1 Tax=Nepenthes gracilis TaxID=150966 RepID=A0AAD3TFN2_NEPGR|nr:hypothetical protein Nepgr_031023 [Nepenthes gracilis]
MRQMTRSDDKEEDGPKLVEEKLKDVRMQGNHITDLSALEDTTTRETRKRGAPVRLKTLGKAVAHIRKGHYVIIREIIREIITPAMMIEGEVSNTIEG